jgi:hypothetical protein
VPSAQDQGQERHEVWAHRRRRTAVAGIAKQAARGDGMGALAPSSDMLRVPVAVQSTQCLYLLRQDRGCFATTCSRRLQPS